MKPMSVLRKKQEGNPAKKRGKRRQKVSKYKEASLQYKCLLGEILDQGLPREAPIHPLSK
jgi:hypothetical protein